MICCGNDTIDPYPLFYEGNLTKLLCISKEAFEKIKTALNEFGLSKKFVLPKPKISLKKTSFKKEHENNIVEVIDDKRIDYFELSNIFNTRNSHFWRLRNLKEWFKEQESYEDLRYIKTSQITI